jgi:hypothetical protein
LRIAPGSCIVAAVATLSTTPEQAAADWVAGLSSKQEKMRRGIESVRTSPGQLAAAQVDVWANNTMAAREKFRRNSAAVSLEDWRSQAIAALPNVAAGAQRKQAIFAQKIAPVLAHIAAGKDRLPARGSYEQNKARATAWMDHMHSYQSR